MIIYPLPYSGGSRRDLWDQGGVKDNDGNRPRVFISSGYGHRGDLLVVLLVLTGYTGLPTVVQGN